jgi:hypothetical protein
MSEDKTAITVKLDEFKGISLLLYLLMVRMTLKLIKSDAECPARRQVSDATFSVRRNAECQAQHKVSDQAPQQPTHFFIVDALVDEIGSQPTS